MYNGPSPARLSRSFSKPLYCHSLENQQILFIIYLFILNQKFCGSRKYDLISSKET